MDERKYRILEELKKQCEELHSREFEFYWEIWGVMWYPWFIEIENKPLRFTANDISLEDLQYFTEKGHIELIKEYKKDEMEF